MKSITSYIFVATALLPALAASVHAQAPATNNANPTPPAEQTATIPTTSAPAPTAQNRGRHFPKIGVNVGVYIPTDARTRNRFGNAWTSVGLGIGSADAPPSAGRFTLDFGLTAENSGNNYAYIVPVGIAYRRAFSAPSVASRRIYIPYYGVSLDAVGVDLKSPQDNVHPGVEVTGGGSITLGTTVGRSAFIEARYSEVAKVKGFDLSGVDLTVGVRF